jgi:hypothetical protein
VKETLAKVTPKTHVEMLATVNLVLTLTPHLVDSVQRSTPMFLSEQLTQE